MPDSVTIQINGLRELSDNMRKLSAAMNNKIARRSTGSAAALVKRRWKQLAPVAAKVTTERGVVKLPGNYRDNIITKKLAPSQTKKTSEHVVLVRGGRKYAYASHTASLLEFGTVNMAPRGVARKAFDATKNDALQVMLLELWLGIDKELQGQ